MAIERPERLALNDLWRDAVEFIADAGYDPAGNLSERRQVHRSFRLVQTVKLGCLTPARARLFVLKRRHSRHNQR